MNVTQISRNSWMGTTLRTWKSQSSIRSKAMKVSTEPKKNLGTSAGSEIGSAKNAKSEAAITTPFTAELTPARIVKIVFEKMYL
jgi:hypothetical protein